MIFEIQGTTKQFFSVGKNVDFYFINCKRYTTADATIRSISKVGKVLFRKNGNIDFTPISNYSGSWNIYTSQCEFVGDFIEIKQKQTSGSNNTGSNSTGSNSTGSNSTGSNSTTGSIPSPSNTSGSVTNTPTYEWGRTLFNSSGVQYGPQFIRALRTPTGIAEYNGYLYITTGLVEGDSGLMKIKNNLRTEVDPAQNGDITLNFTGIKIYDGIKYCVGFDSYGKISSALVAYDQNDNQYIFQYGSSFTCQWQDTPYKSGIHVNKAKITGLDVDATTIYVYCGTTCYLYDRITGQSKGTTSTTIPTSIAKHVKNGNVLEMTSTQVTYNGKVICSLPTSPKVTPYNFSPKDFNTYEIKGSVCIGETGLWVTDSGRCRILQYDFNGNYINQISYLSMNYNCAVDQTVPTRVFAKELEAKVNYPEMTWELVNDWGYGYGSNYQYAGDNLVWYFLRNVTTTPNGTFATIRLQDNSSYDVVKLTENGLLKISTHLGQISLDKDGRVLKLTRSNGKANFYIDDVLKESVTITSDSALNGSGYIGYTADGNFVVYNPDKSHTGYHLSWVKGGVIKNAMPTRSGMNGKQNPFPYGDFFPVDQFVEYAGGNQVYINGNKVFVNYVGEFFGDAGGQTNLWWMFENGTFNVRVGKTSWEAEALDGSEAAREAAGNSYGGGVAFVNNNYYIITNCEHTGALQWFKIK